MSESAKRSGHYRLPGIYGRQLADQARERRPELQVLCITGNAENATLAHGFLDPGMAMITKPFAVDALAQKIRQMIEQGSRGFADKASSV